LALFGKGLIINNLAVDLNSALATVYS